MHRSNSHHMVMGRRTGRLAVAALLIAAGCGGSDDSQPPLLLTEANAQAVAAETLIAAAQTTSGVQSPIGSLALTATSSMRGADRRAVQRLTSRATGASPVAPGSMTQACAAGGTTTTDSTTTTTTITYNNCQENASTRINGTLKYTIKTSGSGGTPTGFSFSVTVNITVTAGTLSFAESGGYDLSFKISTDPTSSGSELQLTGSRLSVSVTGGPAADKLTLSNFDIAIKQDLTNTPNQQLETIDYDLDSTRLKGHISAMTNIPVAQILDAGIPHEFPHAGQVVITGANRTRLQITILGDETFTPPAGQGQVKIELDTGTGTFGAPIWVNWTTLRSMVGSAP